MKTLGRTLSLAAAAVLAALPVLAEDVVVVSQDLGAFEWVLFLGAELLVVEIVQKPDDPHSSSFSPNLRA